LFCSTSNDWHRKTIKTRAHPMSHPPVRSRFKGKRVVSATACIRGHPGPQPPRGRASPPPCERAPPAVAASPMFASPGVVACGAAAGACRCRRRGIAISRPRHAPRDARRDRQAASGLERAGRRSCGSRAPAAVRGWSALGPRVCGVAGAPCAPRRAADASVCLPFAKPTRRMASQRPQAAIQNASMHQMATEMASLKEQLQGCERRSEQVSAGKRPLRPQGPLRKGPCARAPAAARAGRGRHWAHMCGVAGAPCGPRAAAAAASPFQADAPPGTATPRRRPSRTPRCIGWRPSWRT
jgi:hypothetical protein